MAEPTAPPELRLDLHCHTEASHDCVTPLAQIPGRLISRGIHVQAITDHDQIWGAQQLQQLVAENEAWRGKLQIIVGEEISTSEGEIIGLFLTELIPPGLTPEETVARIKAQGGLVSIPHGFDPLKRHRLRPTARERLVKDIDVIEVFNARISNVKWNTAAAEWAAKHGKAQASGSDSHTWPDLGCCAALSVWPGRPLADGEPAPPEGSPFAGTAPGHTRCISGPIDLIAALNAGKIDGRWTHPVWAFILKAMYWIRRKLGLS